MPDASPSQEKRMSTEPDVLVRPISSDDVPWQEVADVPGFGCRYRHLTLASGHRDYRVGVSIEELAPGQRSNPAHYHIFEEEHVFILEGELTVRIGAENFAMRAGDYVCFPAGLKAGHCLVNDSGRACRYVIAGENNPNEVVVYPDSNKVLVRALGSRAIFDMAATRDYWHGEAKGPAAPPPVLALEPDAAKPPVSSDAVEWTLEGKGPRFGGHSRHLTYAAVGGAYHVGVLIEAPEPGMRLWPRHYHMLEEEHALILEGEATLLLGDERHVMKPGDYVCFPAGQKVAHSFLNSGSGPCRYLMIGERNPEDVCIYPDSNKVKVNAVQRRDDIFDMAATRRYWDGEETQ